MPFGLEKKLMAFRSGELDDLVFDRRTVPRATRRDRAAIHRRLADVLLDEALAGFAEERDPAWQLVGVTGTRSGATRRVPEVRPGVIELLDLTLLPLQSCDIDGPAVDARGRSGLEALDDEAGLLELLGEMSHCRFARATTGDLRLRADVNAAAKKRSGRDDDGAGAEAPAFQRL